MPIMGETGAFLTVTKGKLGWKENWENLFHRLCKLLAKE